MFKIISKSIPGINGDVDTNTVQLGTDTYLSCGLDKDKSFDVIQWVRVMDIIQMYYPNYYINVLFL